VGLAWGGLNYGVGKLQGTNPQVQWRNNAWQFTGAPLQIDERPVALGNVQVYHPNWGPGRNYTSSYTGQRVNSGRHEEAHSHQAQRWGPGYLPAVGIGGLLFGDQNPFETAADDYGAGKTTNPFSNRF
jgi:hypothetical protein